MPSLRRRKPRQPDLPAALALVGLLGLAAVAARLLQRRTTRSRAAAAEQAALTWECACGQSFRISGVDRHRVYWLAGASEADPVLGDRCPNCERALP